MASTEPVTIQQAFDETWGKPKKDQSASNAAYAEWEQDKEDRERLRKVVVSLQPQIDKSVNTYVGPKAPPTVRHRARLEAARAVRSYDPSKGASLNTHVHNQLRSIQRDAPAVQDPFSPPERFRRQQYEISSAQETLYEELGRDPTDEEVADATGLPVPRVTKVRTRMRARIPMSAYEENEDDQEAPDIVGGEQTDYDVWVDAVYHDLGETDRIILMHRTGYRGADKLSNQEIAKRLNLTPGAVSQRASRIQRRLDEFHATAR